MWTTQRSGSGGSDKVKKRVRWLLQNGFTFTGKKTIKGKDYLYARKGKVFRSAGPFSIAEPYLGSLISPKEPEPSAPRGADDIAAAARREFDQLEADAMADPSRLGDYISQLVSRRDPVLWLHFKFLEDNYGPNVLDAESVNRSYRESVRTAVARGVRTPTFHDHVVERMKEWIESGQRGRLLPPGTVSRNCPKCHNEMEVYDDPRDPHSLRYVWCKFCHKEYKWNCEVCGETMRCVPSAADPGEKLYWISCLRCPSCGYSLRFKTSV